MKGFPKVINTRADLYNCYQLVKEGELQKEDLLEAIEAIENRNYINCPVMAIDDTKKIITVRYCAEAAAGQKITAGGASYTVAAVEHTEEPDASGDMQPAYTNITTTAKVTGTVERIGIPAPISEFDTLGITADEIAAMKGGLA